MKLTDNLLVLDYPAMTPTVLVLLAAHNGAEKIGNQIHSILNQTGVAIHLAVRNDGSSDSTADVLATLAATESRISLSNAAKPSGGAAKCFFQLILANEATNYQYVAFSDQDDLWYPDKLQRATQMLEQTRCAGYSSAVTAIWPNGKRRTLKQRGVATATDFLFEGAGQGCTFVLSLDFYQRARSFLQRNESLIQNLHFHDWAMYALARCWKLGWVFDPRPSMSYLQHASNDTGAKYSIQGVVRRLTKIRSGWYRAQLSQIADLCYAAGGSADYRISFWRELLRGSGGFRQRLATARFCFAGGRRKHSDNAILIASALAGWV